MSAHIAHTPSPTHSGYTELSPKEFRRKAELVVVLMKAPHAREDFSGHARVLLAADAREARELVRALPSEQPVGVVCPDGECSSRLATHLAREGHRVYHLSGGLREWYHCCGRGHLPA